mgnify:CR=1 FL=1
MAASIAGVKAALGAATDIKDIGGALSKLWSAESAHARNKKTKAPQAQGGPRNKNHQIIHDRFGEKDEAYADDTSFSNVATDVLEERRLADARVALAREIDAKFGKDTFKAIEEEQRRRVKEKAEQARKAKELAREKKEHLDQLIKKILVEGGKALIVVAVLCGLIAFLMYAAKTGGSS